MRAHEVLGLGPDRRLDGTMLVRGFRVGRIQQISHRLYEGLIPYEWLVLGGWRQRSHDSEEGDIVPEELWRTLVANRTSDGMDPPQTYPDALRLAIERRNSNNDIHTADLIRQAPSGPMEEFLKRVQEVTWNRRFFIPSDEIDAIDYRFGIAPTDAKVGDIVCILLGCSVPVVLSPVDGSNHPERYRLIGEAYLHDVMNGELLSYHYHEDTIRKRINEFCLV